MPDCSLKNPISTAIPGLNVHINKMHLLQDRFSVLQCFSPLSLQLIHIQLSLLVNSGIFRLKKKFWFKCVNVLVGFRVSFFKKKVNYLPEAKTLTRWNNPLRSTFFNLIYDSLINKRQLLLEKENFFVSKEDILSEKMTSASCKTRLE